MKSSGIGGQAVLEGVMMQNKEDYAVAVRKLDGEISVMRGKYQSLAEKSLFFRLPIIRGIVVLFESLVIGTRTLAYSVSFYEEEEEKGQEKKRESEKRRRQDQEEKEQKQEENQTERQEEKQEGEQGKEQGENQEEERGKAQGENQEEERDKAQGENQEEEQSKEWKDQKEGQNKQQGEQEEGQGEKQERETNNEQREDRQTGWGQEREGGKAQTGKGWKEGIAAGAAILFAIALALLAFFFLPFFLNQFLIGREESQVVLAAIEGGIRIVLFIGYVIVISFMKNIRRTFMYHGAEHKAINCIENGLELTPENVRRQSKYHRHCKTGFLVFVLFFSILFFMFIHFDNILLRLLSRIVLVPAIAGISYEFIHFAGKSENKIVEILSGPGRWLQMLTTKEPDDSMIEVAIVSIEEVFDWREYQRRCIAATKSRMKLGKSRQEASGRKKSRAELAEEIRRREEEHARRANERARLAVEQERREAEIEKIVDEAEKRKAEQEAMRQAKANSGRDSLSGLDHYFDEKK